MAFPISNDDNDDEEEEEFSGSDGNDNGLDDDLEALKQACLLTGTNLNDLQNDAAAASASAETDPCCSGATANVSDSDDDLELLRSVQSRFAISMDVCQPLSLKPLCALPPSDDDDDDDLETLRAVQRRFAAYDNSDTLTKNTDDSTKKEEQLNSPIVATEVPALDVTLVDGSGVSDVCLNSEEAANTNGLSGNSMEILPSNAIEEHQPDASELLTFMLKSSTFPESAQLFVDAIKRNRSCQKFMRSKLAQIEAKIEENKKLKERVKTLKDFQAACRKVTGRALAQNMDPRIKLISARRTLDSQESKVADKKVSALHSGPVENSHVANYRMALTNFPLSFHREPWKDAEKENLLKGIRQQFQEMIFQFSVDRLSGSEGYPGGTYNLDNILQSIGDLEITPEMIREFLPKVNWEQLASLYVAGRSGAECEARWLNFEDPLINNSEWTKEEQKNLLFIVQEKGITNWFEIAILLGTNRTPSQCLERFQRSLNARILNREWTEDEDARLCNAVKTFGERNWQAVAFALGGRSGTQCSNRWLYSRRSGGRMSGRWSKDEIKRLKVAVKLFGPRNWNKIAQFVPGRTQRQCRERWFDTLNPQLRPRELWHEEEDLKLMAAIEEHGYRWSMVARCLPGRTDNMCLRRFKKLFPHEASLLQEARRIRKAALISNFVDRESERPSLGPDDFVPLPMIGSEHDHENVNLARKRKRISGRGLELRKEKGATPCNASEKNRSRRTRKGVKISSEEGSLITEGTHSENMGGNHSTKRNRKPKSEKYNQTEPDQVHSHEESNSLEQYHRREMITQPLLDGQYVASISCQQDRNKISKSRVTSFSSQDVGAEDGDDVTLASFLRNKSKKRRLDFSKNTDHGCSLTVNTASVLLEKDEHDDGNKMASCLEDGDAQTCYNDAMTCKTQLLDSGNVHASVAGTEPCTSEEPLRELVCESQDGELETDDIKLSSFLKKKLKRRSVQAGSRVQSIISPPRKRDRSCHPKET